MAGLSEPAFRDLVDRAETGDTDNLLDTGDRRRGL
jgi:hypothetical protein